MAGSESASAGPEDLSADSRDATLYVNFSVDRPTIERGLLAAAANQRAAAGEDPLSLFGKTLLTVAEQAEGQLFQDVFALFFNADQQAGTFVEVGTGDGKTISNTYMLEHAFGWSGLVVEPNPTFAESLATHRTCSIARDCVLDVTGREVVFQCLQEPEFSGIALSGSVVDEDMHADKRAGTVRNITMATISLNDLLEREKVAAPINYLSVDVEGAEFAILRTFDFARWRPRCLTVEHNWHRSRADLSDLLRGHGYVQVFAEFSQWDDWFVDRDYLATRPEWAAFLADLEKPHDSEQARTLLAWAQEAITRDALTVASTLCAASLDMDDQISATHRTLADIAQREGRQADAIGHWQRAITTDPDDYWARIGLADLVEVRGDATLAVTLLREAHHLASDTGDAQAVATAETLLARFGATLAPPTPAATRRKTRSAKSAAQRPGAGE